MIVEILRDADESCDRFVRTHAKSKIGHLPVWSRMIEDVSGHQALYLVARQDGSVHGVLPLLCVRNRLFGRRMVSQGFSTYGGPLADCAEAGEALCRRAVELAVEARCESIEFRNTELLPLPLAVRPGKLSMHLALPESEGMLWKGLDAKVRNQVRKAEKAGITSVAGGDELQEDFYSVYAQRMRELGTPPFPRRLMQRILDTFPGDARIFGVMLDGRVIGAGFTIRYNSFVEIPWASTLVEYNKLCPNVLLYWSILRQCCRDGMRVFDFGRSTVDSSTYRFKKQWGAVEVPLHYQYWTRTGASVQVLGPENTRYQPYIEAWKRLPLWVTKLVGPWISRNLP